MIGVTPEQNMEKQIEKQMGCMAGFLQIFDRHQVLTGKRLYATKRLPLNSGVDSTPMSTMGSPSVSRELEKPLQQQQHTRIMSSPDVLKQSPVTELLSPAPEAQSPVEIQSKMPVPLPIFELKEGTKTSWKFCKEAPRLSLDSRATFDAKGGLKPREIRTNAAILSANRCGNNQEEADDNDKQRKSPSVIARLMGLEPLPGSDPDPARKPELRRSASESRASRDLFQYRFIDGVNFQLKQSQQQNPQNCASSNNAVRGNAAIEQRLNGRGLDPIARNVRAEPARVPHRAVGQRKCYFDSADFFPEPKQTVSIYGEIEKRLRIRGIDEPCKDLETLKQILEALQLKGLLHSKKPPQINNRNYVYDDSPIVVMKPARPSPPLRRMGNDSPPTRSRPSPGFRRELNAYGEGISPRRERPEVERSARGQIRGRNASCSPNPSESSVKSPNRRRPLSVETQRRSSSDMVEQRRVSPVHSPKVGLRRTGPDHAVNRSPRNRKPTVEIYHREEKTFAPAEDELSTVSGSSMSTSSHTDTERSRVEDYKEGKNLLERCDKLLHSIAEITATELQPSPVSVLDSSFYKEESSPSPVMKRSVDFNDHLTEVEDDGWSPAISFVESKSEENSEDCDFIYISDILRASNCLPEDSDMFLLLEKQQYLKGKDTSKVSRLQRKLIFDTITEILNRKRQLPPWKAMSCNDGQTSLQQIWSEFQKIRERDASEDLFEVICSVLKKDLAAGDSMDGWGDCPMEMSEAVLDIERLIFKDLIGETIRDLAAFTMNGRCNHHLVVPRRKLVF